MQRKGNRYVGGGHVNQHIHWEKQYGSASKFEHRIIV